VFDLQWGGEMIAKTGKDYLGPMHSLAIFNLEFKAIMLIELSSRTFGCDVDSTSHRNSTRSDGTCRIRGHLNRCLRYERTILKVHSVVIATEVRSTVSVKP